MSQQSLHPMLNIAIKAARQAGALINRASLDIDVLKVGSKGANDFVTEVDQAAERVIIDTLLQAYPDHGILAEESGREHGSQSSEYTWIIDPLDGTTNFIHGFPFYAVSIALSHRGVIQQAVVYDPTRNDLFHASKGRGAYLNERRIRVSKRIRLSESLVGTGFPFRKGDNFTRYVKMFEEVMQSCAGVRRPGAAALDLCYVAAGYYDGFFEMGLSPWDAAAGALMITEAGGLVGNFTGEADFLFQREIVAGAPKVYGQLVKILAPYTRVIKKEDSADAGGAAAEGAPAHLEDSREDIPEDSPEQALSRTLRAPAAAVAARAAARAAAEAREAEPRSTEAPRRAPVRVRRSES